VANFTQADTAGTTAGSVEVYNLNSGSPIDLIVDAFGYFTGGTSSTAVNGTAADVISTPITVNAAGTSLPADGASNDTITTTVYHGANPGGGTVAGDIVSYTVTPSVVGDLCGTVSPTPATTNASGVATTKYTAPLYSATTTLAPTCTITATDSIYTETGTVTIPQTAPPSSIALSGNANIPANGTATDLLTATVTPAAGENVNGETVTFTATSVLPGNTYCGTLASATETTPATGPATVTDLYTAGTHSGECEIGVTDGFGGTTAAPAFVDQTASPALQAGTVTVTAPTTNPDSVVNTTASVPVTVVAKDGTGAVIANDPVTFTISGACGADTGANDVLTSGTGSATYTYIPSTTVTGTCTVVAQEAETGAKSTGVAIVQTAPTASVTATPATSTLAPGTGETITVTTANAPTSDASSPITFNVTGSASCGTIPATTAAATAPYGGTSTFTAGTSTGVCSVTATEGGVTSAPISIDQT
jgi:adhesin/invasin